MKIFYFLKNIFKRKTTVVFPLNRHEFSIIEFIKRNKLENLNREQFIIRLNIIVRQRTGGSWFLSKEKEIAKILLKNPVQNIHEIISLSKTNNLKR